MLRSFLILAVVVSALAGFFSAPTVSAEIECGWPDFEQVMLAHDPEAGNRLGYGSMNDHFDSVPPEKCLYGLATFTEFTTDYSVFTRTTFLVANMGNGWNLVSEPLVNFLTPSVTSYAAHEENGLPTFYFVNVLPDTKYAKVVMNLDGSLAIQFVHEEEVPADILAALRPELSCGLPAITEVVERLRTEVTLPTHLRSLSMSTPAFDYVWDGFAGDCNVALTTILTHTLQDESAGYTYFAFRPVGQSEWVFSKPYVHEGGFLNPFSYSITEEGLEIQAYYNEGTFMTFQVDMAGKVAINQGFRPPTLINAARNDMVDLADFPSYREVVSDHYLEMPVNPKDGYILSWICLQQQIGQNCDLAVGGYVLEFDDTEYRQMFLVFITPQGAEWQFTQPLLVEDMIFYDVSVQGNHIIACDNQDNKYQFIIDGSVVTYTALPHAPGCEPTGIIFP